VKIVFFMFHAGFVRNYEPVLRALAERGHAIQLRYDILRKDWELTPANALAAAYPNITVGRAPIRRVPTVWMRLATVVRHAMDYLRYLHPEYVAATGLRARAEERAPRGIITVGGFLSRAGYVWVRRLLTLLRAIERVIPTVAEVDRFLAKEAPDLVVVTPLVDFGSGQVDYIKSAQRLGLRTAAWIASWDNLTNKGLLRVRPDRLFVWNEAQRHEAETFHDIPADRVVVTGAQIFDHWFGRQPRRSREAFCAHVGLDPTRDFILYLGSSAQIAPDEVGFAASWVRLLRSSSSSALREVSILFRPHPARVPLWLALDSAKFAGVAIWPREASTNAFDPGFNDDYFDSMYYARVVVGVNTSGMIESGILGKPVHTWRTPEFAAAQAGTLHFQHLISINGGLLHVATSEEEHLRMLDEALVAPPAPDARSRRFVEAFVRPHGLDEPATPRFVAAVEQLLGQPAPPAVMHGVGVRIARPFVRLAAPLVVTAASDKSLGEIVMGVVVGVVVRAMVLAHTVRGWFRPAAAPATRRTGTMFGTGGRAVRRGARQVWRSIGASRRRAAKQLRPVWREIEVRTGRLARRGGEFVKETRKALRRAAKAGRQAVRFTRRQSQRAVSGVARRLGGG
jgi:hypothetical protein